MLNRFQMTICIPGAISGDFAAHFVVPSDCSLVHISHYCITQDATLIVGVSGGDTDAYLEIQTVTAGTALEIELADFVGEVYPHFEDGDGIVVTIGHGSNCVDTTVVLTFTEG